MCGIAGIVNLKGQTVGSERIRSMMYAVKHRGPDDDGTYIENDVGFGFVRLSILDLSPAGHQPFFSDDGNLIIIFNGEIFNYVELRAELIQKGHQFSTKTDTEVLIKSFKEWREACQHKFNGMWAFAIYDKKNRTLFASRDRYGIKPFYYSLSNDELVFASEIPAILKVLGDKPMANNQAIFDFLVFNRTDQNENTFFKGIKKLQHGHSFLVDLKTAHSQFTINKWYDLRLNLKEPFRSPEEYYACFKSAIDLRMRSDVPVGVGLSGGLDSSSILSVLLTDPRNSDINTFSAVYNEGDKGDETKFIKEYRTTVKNMHFVRPDAETFFQDMDSFVKAHGEPIPSTSAYAEYRVKKLAKGTVTVILDGQGADEQLGGYHYFFGLYYKELLLKFKIFRLLREIIFGIKVHKSLFAFKTFIFFLLPEKLRVKAKTYEKGYLTNDFNKNYSGKSHIAGDLYGSRNLQEAFIDHFEYKMEHHLKWGDFNSMSNSIESRMPFLDHRLVESTLSMPSESFIRGGVTKYILRAAMKGVLPEKIRMRVDKIGFGTPEAEWFRHPLFVDYVENILNSKSFKDRGIVEAELAKKLHTRHVAGSIDISKEIWKWIHLELWFRNFIDAPKENLKHKQICTVGVWDETIPGIHFAPNGVSNYAKIFSQMTADYPRGKEGQRKWMQYVEMIKNKGKAKKYDCIIGVSGGTDSSYLLHLAKESGLRPLAVYLDNGWASETAVSNIEKMTRALDVDLVTYVIDYVEVTDVLKAYLRAGLPWADSPTDLAIKAILYEKAAKYGLKYVLIGHDFRTEGFQPTEWTYSDGKQLVFLTRKFGRRRLKSFPSLSFSKFIYYSYFRKIKMLKPFFYLDYNKSEAKKLLQQKYDWRDYGGHHYENIFTRFVISYWLFEKFGIDKRKITFSALILNGEMKREDALRFLETKPYKEEEIQNDISYVCKKLNLSTDEFSKIFKSGNRLYSDYPSYYPLIIKIQKFIFPLIKYFLPNKPLFIYQVEGRNAPTAN